MLFRNISLTLLSVALLSGQASAMNCCPWQGDMALTGGYRSDTIEATVKGFDPPGNLVFTNVFKGDDIDIYEIGFKGSILLCNRWLVRGYVDTGEVHDGKYSESFTVIGEDDFSLSTGKASKGNSYDTSVGFGYMFTCLPCVNFGPVAGYSYHNLKIKMPKVKTDGVEDEVLNGLSYDSRWQGPWLGFDIHGRLRCFDLNFGYSYHWSHWRAAYELKGPPNQETAFSDRRKSTDAHGNVVFVDGSYYFMRCLSFGVGFKYQSWRATDGSIRPKVGTYSDLGFSDTFKSNVPEATWKSYEVKLILAYHF